MNFEVGDPIGAPDILEKDAGPTTVELQKHFVVVIGDISLVRHFPVELADGFRRCIEERHILVEPDKRGQKPEGDIMFGQSFGHGRG